MRDDSRDSLEWEVRDPEAARLLLDEKARRLLSPFVGRERTASDVAEAVGLPLTTALYQLRRLQDAGLLRVTDTRRRAGKALKLYRAVAERFLVPYDVTPALTPEALLHAEHAPWEARLVRGLVAAGGEALDGQGRPAFGVRVVLEGDRLVPRNVVGPDASYSLLGPDAPAIVDYWLGDVELGFEDAKALQRELCELVARYRDRRGGGPAYVLRVAMAPSGAE